MLVSVVSVQNSTPLRQFGTKTTVTAQTIGHNSLKQLL